MITQYPVIKPQQFGKDHWGLLAYIETCVVDGKPLDNRRMRVHPERHLLVAHLPRWAPTWGTRLADGTRLDEHDDWDCLYDLEAAGYVEILEPLERIVQLTPQGTAIAHYLRKHKGASGSFGTFAAAFARMGAHP